MAYSRQVDRDVSGRREEYCISRYSKTCSTALERQGFQLHIYDRCSSLVHTRSSCDNSWCQTCNADDATPASSIWPSAVETSRTSDTAKRTDADMFVGISLAFCERETIRWVYIINTSTGNKGQGVEKITLNRNKQLLVGYAYTWAFKDLVAVPSIC